MTKLDELIKKYEKELQDILSMFDVTDIKDISNVRYRTFAEAIRNFIVDLKNLPNELKGVSNNEDENKFCPHCHKYKRLQGNGIIHPLCECGD